MKLAEKAYIISGLGLFLYRRPGRSSDIRICTLRTYYNIDTASIFVTGDTHRVNARELYIIICPTILWALSRKKRIREWFL